MPPTEAEIQAWLDRLEPASLFSLSEIDERRLCPICGEPYEPVGEADYAVRVPMCDHVFGRLCIEQHVRSGRRYSTQCPMCRGAWFATAEEDFGETWSGAYSQWNRLQDLINAANDMAAEEDAIGAEEGAIGGEAIAVRLRQPAEVRFHDADAPEPVHIPDAPEVVSPPPRASGGIVGAVDSQTSTGLSDRGRLYRSIGFLEMILSDYELNAGDAQVAAGVRAIERAAEVLWQRIEEIDRERRDGQGGGGRRR